LLIRVNIINSLHFIINDTSYSPASLSDNFHCAYYSEFCSQSGSQITKFWQLTETCTLLRDLNWILKQFEAV
jgi:hypothetical protein